MIKLDQALAAVEEARAEPKSKQDLLAEAVMLTVQQMRICDDKGLEELSRQMSDLAESTGLTEVRAQNIAWRNE